MRNLNINNMDTLGLYKVKSSFILILIENDDGTKKKQTLEKTTKYAFV